MKSVEDLLKFCNADVNYDYKNKVVVVELNQVRKCVINNFHETIRVSRIIKSISIIDDIIFKIHDGDDENIIDNLHDLIENIFFMLSFQKVNKEDVDKVME